MDIQDINEAADVIIQSEDLTAQNSAIAKILHKVLVKRLDDIKDVEAELFNKKNSLSVLINTLSDSIPK